MPRKIGRRDMARIKNEILFVLFVYNLLHTHIITGFITVAPENNRQNWDDNNGCKLASDDAPRPVRLPARPRPLDLVADGDASVLSSSACISSVPVLIEGYAGRHSILRFVP